MTLLKRKCGPDTCVPGAGNFASYLSALDTGLRCENPSFEWRTMFSINSAFLRRFFPLAGARLQPEGTMWIKLELGAVTPSAPRRAGQASQCPWRADRGELSDRAAVSCRLWPLQASSGAVPERPCRPGADRLAADVCGDHPRAAGRGDRSRPRILTDDTRRHGEN